MSLFSLLDHSTSRPNKCQFSSCNLQHANVDTAHRNYQPAWRSLASQRWPTFQTLRLLPPSRIYRTIDSRGGFFPPSFPTATMGEPPSLRSHSGTADEEAGVRRRGASVRRGRSSRIDLALSRQAGFGDGRTNERTYADRCQSIFKAVPSGQVFSLTARHIALLLILAHIRRASARVRCGSAT